MDGPQPVRTARQRQADADEADRDAAFDGSTFHRESLAERIERLEHGSRMAHEAGATQTEADLQHRIAELKLELDIANGVAHRHPRDATS